MSDWAQAAANVPRTSAHIELGVNKCDREDSCASLRAWSRKRACATEYQWGSQGGERPWQAGVQSCGFNAPCGATTTFITNSPNLIKCSLPDVSYSQTEIFFSLFLIVLRWSKISVWEKSAKHQWLWNLGRTHWIVDCWSYKIVLLNRETSWMTREAYIEQTRWVLVHELLALEGVVVQHIYHRSTSVRS